jgi:hypothetical protein|tara:strand:+ start:1861 stop:2529 length:669 start_codon:yes stop_codon:yes gene_type:complete
MNFDDRIEDLAGTLVQTDGTTEAADKAVFFQQAMQEACQDVARNAIKIAPKDAHLFVSKTTLSTNINLDEIEEIVSIERDGSEVRAIHYSERFGAVNADSISFATTNDPVWWIEDGYLNVKPDYGAASFMYAIPSYTIAAGAATATIGDFPAKYYDHAVLYAAYLVLCRRELDINDVIRNYTQSEEDVELAASAAQSVQLIQAKKQMVFQKYNRLMGIEVQQ